MLNRPVLIGRGRGGGSLSAVVGVGVHGGNRRR